LKIIRIIVISNIYSSLITSGHDAGGQIGSAASCTTPTFKFHGWFLIAGVDSIK